MTYEGYFTDGPNGDFNLTATCHGKTQEIDLKLKDGKEINWAANPIFIDNPEALNCWVD